MNRRSFFKVVASSSVFTVSGCISILEPAEESRTEEEPIDTSPEVAEKEALLEWDKTKTCVNGQSSEISVVAVEESIGDKFLPIKYSDLPAVQKDILTEVLETGGYIVCDPSEAFNSFINTAVTEYAREQDGDDLTVYLEYDGLYYQLYLQKQDQVFTY